MADPAFGAMVLAAGNSSRMGSPKQRIKVGESTLLGHTVRCAVAGGASDVVVVLGSQAGEFRGEAEASGGRVVVNNEWETGMASSVRAGLGAILARDPAIGAVLILLGDQPEISVDAIQALVGAHRKSGGVTASGYGGTAGAPALFPASAFARLRALEGDQGARLLLRAEGSSLTVVDRPELGVDLDTPGDLAAWRATRA